MYAATEKTEIKDYLINYTTIPGCKEMNNYTSS